MSEQVRYFHHSESGGVWSETDEEKINADLNEGLVSEISKDSYESLIRYGASDHDSC